MVEAKIPSIPVVTQLSQTQIYYHELLAGHVGQNAVTAINDFHLAPCELKRPRGPGVIDALYRTDTPKR